MGTVARLMGLEFGVLRDAKSGLIYVVDANWTSWGPLRGTRLRSGTGAARHARER